MTQPYDCERCLADEARVTRQDMHCGFLPRKEWREPMLPVALGPQAYDCDTCPGWVVRQAAVAEAAEAAAALEIGALELYDPEGLNVVWELAVRGRRARNNYERERMKRIAARGGK